jgi:hypothetical protein
VHGSRTGTSATLALRDGEHGLIVRCWAGCDPRDVLAALRRLGLIGGGGERRGLTLRGGTANHRDDDASRQIELARRIWAAARDAHRSPVERYLAGRGITTAPPPSLRYTPTLRRPDGTRGPAMVARIDDIDGELIGLSRTWLLRGQNGDWRRHDRAMIGRASGGAVRLAPAAETLLTGEGIETCLAPMQSTGIPAWAALSTSGLIALVLPPVVRHIIILADNDRSGAGERAARAAAARWIAESRRVRIAIPPEPGTDFNDVLLGCGHAESGDAAA